MILPLRRTLVYSNRYCASLDDKSNGGFGCISLLKTNYMRVQFNQVFTMLGNDMIKPITTIQVNGQILSPGASFGSGATFGGVNFFDHLGQDIEVEQLPNGIYEIKGFYQ